MEEPEANSEAEEVYENLDVELLAIIGSTLLATSAFDAKSLNKKAQEVQRKANSTVANSKKKIDTAALNDLLGTFILDAIQVVPSAEPDIKDAEQEAAKAYKRYLDDAEIMQRGMITSARRQYLEAARKAATMVDKVGTRPAMADAISELAQKGITCYEYTRKDGVVVQVPTDVGIRRAIKSNDNLRSRANTTLGTASRTTGLVEVSITAGARKSHARWQGKVYQLEGSSKEYPNFYKACKWGDPVDGILGYNCGHRFRVYYPGLGKQYTDPLDGTGYTNAQVRDLKTTQRKYENDLRKLKREREVLKKCGLDTKDVNKKIRAKSAQIDKLIDENSKVLKRERWRETIYEKARREVDAYGTVHIDKSTARKISEAEHGAIYGALNDKNDPTRKKRDDHAKRYYSSTRKRNAEKEVSAISNNTGINEQTISAAYNHLFKKKHYLSNGYTYFDPDYDIAQSWQRLREGRNIQPHDLTLIRHEAAEAEFMAQGMSYAEAHLKAEQMGYNYAKELIEFLKGGEQDAQV